MTGGMHYTPSHTKVCKFYDFQLAFSQLIFHLKFRNLAGLLKLRCSFQCWYSFLILTYLNFRPPFWRRVYYGAYANHDGDGGENVTRLKV